MYKSYEDLVNFIINGTTEEEKQWLSSETELFRERGWEQYILFLANLINSFEIEKRYYLFFYKSAMDSYLLAKACTMPNSNKLLNNQKCKQILFNDALRIDIDFVGLTRCFTNEIYEVGQLIENGLNTSGLKYIERIIPQNRKDDNCELILVSRGEIPKEDINIVLNEKTNSTKEETDILRKYLIMRFATRNRL